MRELLSYGHIQNQKMHPHRNKGMEIVLVDRGHLEWAVDEQPEQLQSGSVFFTLPWQTHGSTTIREPQNKIFYALFKLKREYQVKTEKIRFPDILGFSTSEQNLLSDIFCKASRHTWNASPLLLQLFPEFIDSLESKSKMDKIASAPLLKFIIIELARVIEKGGVLKMQGNATVKKVELFLEALNIDLETPWTLDQMSEACGVKRTQFAKITRQVTGYPPLTYFALLRFSRACHLLSNTEMSVTDIAFSCGYSSSQYFADSFRKRANMTPTFYRRDAPEIKTIFASNWESPEWRSIEEEQVRSLEAKQNGDSFIL